jgi:alkylated DNA nucleotide flippase Atl1
MFKKLFGISSTPAIEVPRVDPHWWTPPTLAVDKYQEVVGESFYQPAIKAAQESYGRAQIAQLVREPRNKHDRNAVAVRLAGSTVGHIPANEALGWHHVLGQQGGTATARASITGGYNERYSWGVVLHAAPEPWCPDDGFFGGLKRLGLTTLKAYKDAALAAVTDPAGVLATLTVDDDGTVWAFSGEVALGKMTKAASDDYAMPVRACAAVGVPPTCRVVVEEKADGTPKLVALAMPMNETWSALRYP